VSAEWLRNFGFLAKRKASKPVILQLRSLLH
jgi:hypothetical protein